jgi:hypothetical protein
MQDAAPAFVESRHAQVRQAERSVPREAKAHVLANYDTSHPAPYRQGATRTIIYIGDWQGRRLKVYVEEDSSPPKIKTVAWEGE